ncbi:MAG: hypothetical protein VX642_09805 [Bdellovibrionota bacterium]|nr:hypothetical protein [Bdellovibrionota bacterium]
MKHFLLISIFCASLFADEYEKLELHKMCESGEDCVSVSHSHSPDDLQVLLEKSPVFEIKKKEISKATIENLADDSRLVSLKLSIDKVAELHKEVPAAISSNLFVVSNGLLLSQLKAFKTDSDNIQFLLNQKQSDDNKKAMFWLERHSQKTMVTKKKHLRFQKVAYAMIASCVFFLALFWFGTRKKNQKIA